MNNQKSVFRSKTMWGIVATVLTAVALPAWEGYRDSGTWQGVIDNALPALITVIPAGFATYGRVVAKDEVGF